jgi:hypothetical protein
MVSFESLKIFHFFHINGFVKGINTLKSNLIDQYEDIQNKLLGKNNSSMTTTKKKNEIFL